MPVTIPELPVWVAAVSFGAFMMAGAIRWMLQTVQMSRKSNGDGSFQSNIVGSLTHLTNAVAQLGGVQEDVQQELRHLRRVAEQTAERIGNLPTKLDLNETAKENRHATMNAIQQLQSGIYALDRKRG